MRRLRGLCFCCALGCALLSAGLSSCGAKNASSDRVNEVAMVIKALADTESARVLADLATATALQRIQSGLTLESCVPSSSDGCSRYCNTAKTQKIQSCEVATLKEYTCGTSKYSLAKVKSNANAGLSRVSQSSGGLSGTLPMDLSLSTEYTGPKDVYPVSLSCQMTINVQVQAGEVVGMNLQCLKFDCKVGGQAVVCDRLQTALKLQTCDEAESGGGGDGGTSPVVAPGSCRLANSTRCQDFTGVVWSATLVQQNCTSPNTYSADSCDTSSRLGSCTVNASLGLESKLRFYTDENLTTAQTTCSVLSGTFTAD